MYSNTLARLARAAWLAPTVAAMAAIIVSGAARAQPVSGADWAKTVSAAQKEGRVYLYSSAVPPVLARIKADFDRANPGIVLEYNRYAGGEIMTRLEQERSTGADGADVHISTEIPWFEARQKEGNLKAPTGPSAAGWPAAYTLTGGVPVLAIEPLIIVYNTNLVKTPVTGYRDLLRPEFKGKLGIPEVVATTLVAWYDWLEKTQGPDFLPALAAQQPRPIVSTPVAAQSVGSGELAIHPFVNTGVAMPLIAQGAPMKIAFPNPGFGIRYAGGALGWAKRPNAAQVFMEYIMSVRGQTTWNGQGDSASPLANIPGSLDAKTINPYDPNPYPPAVVNAYRAKWNAVFKK